jgi:hypothetical protein
MQPYTYFASRLALSPKGPKWASTWASSPWSTIGCVQNDFWPYGTFGVNHASILLRHKHRLWIDRNEIPHEPSPRSSIGFVPNDFQAYGTFGAKPCTYLASRLALSPNRTKWAFTWALSSRSTIRCVQNDFEAYGTFNANRAPILHQD